MGFGRNGERVAKTPMRVLPPSRGGRTVGEKPSRSLSENSQISHRCETPSLPRRASGVSHGGSSTTIYRSGTPALALAVSSEEALRLALENQEKRIAYAEALNRYLRDELAKYPAVRINSPENAVPHILNLSVRGVKGTVFQRELGKRGVCVSVKSACSTEGTPSKAVFAVSRDRKNALSSWRISLSHLTTWEELQEFLRIFDSCYKELVA